MPLLDHFHPPLYPQRSWESFHSRWANTLADALHVMLPSSYFTEVQIHLGTRVETDVAEFELTSGAGEEQGNGAAGGVALQTWAPPAATIVMPAEFPDDIEVHILDERDDARLVAVIELVSPRNKDRPECRRAFVAKSAAYLQRGIGLMMLDIVTSRHANFHNELMQFLNLGDEYLMPTEALLYTTSYRPLTRDDANWIEGWMESLTIGGNLPVMPLSLRGYRAIPVDLEATYNDACQRSRL